MIQVEGWEVDQAYNRAILPARRQPESGGETGAALPSRFPALCRGIAAGRAIQTLPSSTQLLAIPFRHPMLTYKVFVVATSRP